jgi:hypothetical protein
MFTDAQTAIPLFHKFFRVFRVFMVLNSKSQNRTYQNHSGPNSNWNTVAHKKNIWMNLDWITCGYGKFAVSNPFSLNMVNSTALHISRPPTYQDHLCLQRSPLTWELASLNPSSGLTCKPSSSLFCSSAQISDAVASSPPTGFAVDVLRLSPTTFLRRLFSDVFSPTSFTIDVFPVLR